MTNILGLDIGEKRVGVAIYNEGIVAGLETLSNTGLESTLSQIAKICHEKNIEQIVIGLPKGRSLQVEKIHKFAIELAKILNLPIDYEDETLTSKEAERILSDSNIDPKSLRFKEEVDKLSAKMLLEQFISKIK